MSVAHLNAIFNAESVAIVGASNRPHTVGNAIFRNLLGTYKGSIYPVNPKGDAIMGVHAYRELADLPVVVDLVVIAVPTNSVVDVVRTAGRLGVKGAVVITAGFKEVGEEGLKKEQELQRAAKETGICMVGPNCLGVINASASLRMNATFGTRMPRPGNIAFMSQSGALCTAVMDEAEKRNLGFSKFVSFGNKADMNECDILSFLRDDKETKVICMYLEEISDGRNFMRIARDVAWAAKKPMVAIKSGTSADGRAAAASHTGALSGSERAYDAIFRQSGILRVETINELFDAAQALSLEPMPRGSRVGIITNAGGPGIIVTDALERHGLKLAQLTEPTMAKLVKGLPSFANTHNPVDVIGDAGADRYKLALEAVLDDDGVDGAVVILTPQAMTEVLPTAMVIPPLAKRHPSKPVVAAFMGAYDVQDGVEHLQDHGIPNYAFPEAAVRSLAAMRSFGEIWQYPRREEPPRFEVDRAAVAAIVDECLAGQASALLHQSKAGPLLQAYGLPVLGSRLAATEAELPEAVAAVGFPLVMKITSPDIAHKSEAGGVKLNIKSLEQATAAFREILANAKAYKADARIEGVYLEQMAGEGVEVIIGATRDRKFGPMVMFGLGGTFVEVFEDVTFRLAPMWEVSAEIMLREVKAHKILEGVRGKPASDQEAIKQCILRVAQLMDEVPEIQELDVNPLVVYPKGQGCKVADCRIVLQRQ